MRVRFTSEDDLNLLKEVFAENPFEQTSRWSTIGTNVGDAVVPAKTFRVALSGTDEQYSEKTHLLQEIWDMAKIYGYGMKRRPQAAARQAAAALRDSAAANFKPSTMDTDDSALVVPTSVEPPPETAEDIFEGIYDDPPELPHCGDESQQAVVQEQPDCADVSGAGTPQSDQALRNQTSRIQASNNHEFLEKRWNHKRELNAQATQVELEKIALKREELEAKERRSERKSKHQQNKLEKDYTLKEKELELRAHELKVREQQNEMLSNNQQALLQIIDAVVNKLAM
ncbi:hypothetical protein HPB49_023528 [Dermacentor silvarum]|uniref:Uncharacterized protein n=1 Tax=Dermacentor silvarum TaxID=543639 RepID=A0ACB8DRU2_DERSI|nr:hypothetical protein HPB49_023528 [Dermacentor silvarum]